MIKVLVISFIIIVVCCNIICYIMGLDTKEYKRIAKSTMDEYLALQTRYDNLTICYDRLADSYEELYKEYEKLKGDDDEQTSI